MKFRLFSQGLLAGAFLLALPARLPAKETPKEPDNRPELAIIVSEGLQNQGSAFTDFDRLDLAFQQVAKKRQWPVKIVADRFAANTPKHETELQIFCQPLRREIPLEVVFRGWMTLIVQDKKHDFGLVTYRYNVRIGENSEDMIEKVYLGAANAAADKIEPILFPKDAKPKP